MPLAGLGTGVLVESHMGRPTKIEGNPDHPASKGGTDAFMQASILNLYDPDRETGVTYLGRPSTWNDALAALRKALREGDKGRGFRILTEAVSSPSLAAWLERLLREFRRHSGISMSRRSATASRRHEMAFGKAASPFVPAGPTSLFRRQRFPE